MTADLETRLKTALTIAGAKPKKRTNAKPTDAPIDVWTRRIVAMVKEMSTLRESLFPVALECEMSSLVGECSGKQVAIAGTADFVGFISDRDAIGDDGVVSRYPSDRLCILDWKTSEKADGVYQFTRDVLPQLALYSMLARSHFGLDYYPAVAPVRLVYSTAAKKGITAKIQFGALREVTQRVVDRAVSIAIQDAAIKRAVYDAGMGAPRPDSGTFKCTACAYQAECFSYDRDFAKENKCEKQNEASHASR